MPLGRKTTNNRKKPSGIPTGLLFWVAFFVIVALLFIINIPRITKTWENVFGTQNSMGLSEADLSSQTESPDTLDSNGPPSIRIEEPGLTGSGEQSGENAYRTDSGQVHDDQGPEAAPGTTGNTAAADLNPPRRTPTESSLRERTAYLVRVDSAGLVFMSAVKRSVPSNESPLLTILNTLLLGPDIEEKKQGLITLIPQGTKILGATVTGNTAVINFNENFLFNSFGAEGYIAQLKQIIWTATEFPNVTSVEFRIDGKKVAFLGETIRLDRPMTRDTF